MKGKHIDSRLQHRLICGHVAGQDMYCAESWCRMSRVNVESERARMSARWSRPGASWADRSLSTGECSRCGYVVCGCEAEKGATAISGYYDRMIAVAKRWKIVEDERASFNDRIALAERMYYDGLIDPKAAERVLLSGITPAEHSAENKRETIEQATLRAVEHWANRGRKVVAVELNMADFRDAFGDETERQLHTLVGIVTVRGVAGMDSRHAMVVGDSWVRGMPMAEFRK